MTARYILLNDELQASNYDVFKHTFTIGLQSDPEFDDDNTNLHGILFHKEEDVMAAICEWNKNTIAWVGVITLCKRSSDVYVSDTTRKTDLCVLSKLIPFDEFISKLTMMDITVARINETPRLLQFVDSEKQTTELCMAAVRKDGDALQWVQQATFDICRAAVLQNPEAIRFVQFAFFSNEMNKELIHSALSKDYLTFFKIPREYKTADACWIVLRRHASMITCIPGEIQTQEMWEFVIRQQPALIKELQRFSTNINTNSLFQLALHKDGMLLEHVRQTRELCEIAVRQNGAALEFVRESFRTPELCMIAVKTRGSGAGLKWVPSEVRTPELERVAVETNGYAIEWVTEQTPELCRLALDSNNPAIFKFIKHQTPELCEYAIRRNPSAIHWIHEPTRELCCLVLQNPQGDFGLLPALFQTDEMRMYAVQHNGMRISVMKGANLTPELCMAAVQQNGLALAWIPDVHKTPELLMAAVCQNGSALVYISAKHQTPELCRAAIEQTEEARDLCHCVEPVICPTPRHC